VVLCCTIVSNDGDRDGNRGELWQTSADGRRTTRVPGESLANNGER
jgi:hypothetical protein